DDGRPHLLHELVGHHLLRPLRRRRARPRHAGPEDVRAAQGSRARRPLRGCYPRLTFFTKTDGLLLGTERSPVKRSLVAALVFACAVPVLRAQDMGMGKKDEE